MKPQNTEVPVLVFSSVIVIAFDYLIRHAGASEVEKTLMKNLFDGYNLKVRPAVRPEERVVVRVGMVLSSFVGLVRNSILLQQQVGWESQWCNRNSW